MSRKYTAAEKAEALVMYASDGLSATWRALGIPKPTLASWVRSAGFPHTGGRTKTREATEVAAERAKLLREGLKLNLLEKVVDLLERMDAPHVEFKGKEAERVEYPIAPAAAVQNYATSVGILIDKFRLESGEATGVNESRSVTVGLDDHERTALRSAIDQFLKARADAVPE